MKKTFCDICEKEIDKNKTYFLGLRENLIEAKILSSDIRKNIFEIKEMCFDCANFIIKRIKEYKNINDY